MRHSQEAGVADQAPLFSLISPLKGIDYVTVKITPLLFSFKLSLAICFIHNNLGGKGVECSCVC